MIGVISRKAAKVQGLAHYFTGKPCRHGHVAERLTSSKNCLVCVRLRVAKWRAANSTRSRQSQQQYYQRNCEEIKQRKRQARADNLQAYRDGDRRRNTYRIRNRDPEKNRKYARQWRCRNPEKNRQQVWDWRNAHPERVREQNKIHKQLRRAREWSASGQFTANDVLEIMKAQRCRCAYCGANIRKQYHVDHIVPLARGGSNERKNIQLTCPPCNRKKNGRDPLQFARSLGRLL